MKKIFLSMVTAAFLLTGCAVTDRLKQVNETVTPPSEQRGGFDDLVGSFNGVYKSALLTTGQADTVEDEAKAEVEETVTLWEKVENEFKDSRPDNYDNTDDWANVVVGIGNLVREARSLTEQGSLVQAHEKLEQVREWLRAVREENSVQSLSDLMLSFHDTMEELIAAGGKDDELIEELDSKLEPIATWSELADDEIYQTMVGDLQTIINELKASEGDQYDEVRGQVKPAFIKLYMTFG